MNMRKLFIYSVVLILVCAASQLAFAPSGFASHLTIEVWTDKPEYRPGDEVTIMAMVSYDGRLIDATIEAAHIDIRPARDDEFRYRHIITREFEQLRPGLFIANVTVGEPGGREIYVSASALIREGPCCKTIYGFGVASFSVGPLCPPGYYPCGFAPCGTGGAATPDFSVKHSIELKATGEKWISFGIPNYVTEELSRRAHQVTFREASPRGAEARIYDTLSDLGLSLSRRTGEVTGYLNPEEMWDPDYSFLIEALSPEGNVIGKISVQIEIIWD
jgi:hypothetical protein